MLQSVTLKRWGGMIMADEKSTFAIDWKAAIFGAVVLIGLVATVVTAVLEGLPWVTKEEMNYRDQIWDAKMQNILSAISSNNQQISAINSQQSSYNTQMTALSDAEKQDRHDIDMLITERHKVNSLQRKYRQSEDARSLDRQHYSNELKAMERARAFYERD